MIESIFDQIDTAEKAYWLGFLAADGSVKNNKIKIHLSIKDEDQINRFIKFIQADNISKKYYTNKKTGVNSVMLYFSSNAIAEALKKYGIQTPKQLVLPETKFFKPYLLGFFDGDGSISGNTISLCSGDKNFLMKISSLITNSNAKVFVRKNHYGQACYLTLPHSFYKEMLGSFTKSMPRKRQINQCLDCKQHITNLAKRCFECSNKSQIHYRNTKIKWPPIDSLVKMVKDNGYAATGRKLGVSDNAVRKHIKKHLPRQSAS